MDGRIAHEHVGVSIPPQRGVFAQALIQPEGKLKGDVVGEDGLDGSAVKHVVDHGVAELVVDHVAEFAVVSFEGNDNPVLEQLRDPPDPLFQILGDDVGLLEIIVRIVDDERNAVHKLVAEELGQGGVGRLGGGGGKLREHVPPVGEIDVKVVGLEERPVELPVLDLILAEHLVLRPERPRADG